MHVKQGAPSVIIDQPTDCILYTVFKIGPFDVTKQNKLLSHLTEHVENVLEKHVHFASFDYTLALLLVEPFPVDAPTLALIVLSLYNVFPITFLKISFIT